MLTPFKMWRSPAPVSIDLTMLRAREADAARRSMPSALAIQHSLPNAKRRIQCGEFGISAHVRLLRLSHDLPNAATKMLLQRNLSRCIELPSPVPMRDPEGGLPISGSLSPACWRAPIC